MKLVFISVSIQFTKYQYEIGEYLEQKGVQIVHVTYSKECYDFLTKHEVSCEYIPNFISGYYDETSLSVYEKRYGFKRDDLLTGDFDVSKKPRQEALNMMLHNLRFWKEFIDKEKPDMIIGSSERFVGMIPYYICKNTNTRYYFWSRCAIPNRFWLSQETITGRITNISQAYESLKGKQLSDTNAKLASRIMSSIISNKQTTYLVVGEPTVNPSLVKTFIHRLWLNFSVENFRNPYARVIGIAYEQVKKIYRAREVKRYYRDFDSNRPYVFYPLHLPDDCQLLVRAPQYLDQLELIKRISAHLNSVYPGITLVVKEHPNNIGGMPVKVMEEMSRLPNVMLIDPHVPSHDVTSHSLFIVTINSTVGWEAMLYSKPVITLAPCFYDCFDGIIKNKGLDSLPSDMKLTEKHKVSKDELLRCVFSVYQGSYPGLFNFYPGKESAAMKPDNLKLMSEGVYHELCYGKKV